MRLLTWLVLKHYFYLSVELYSTPVEMDAVGHAPMPF